MSKSLLGSFITDLRNLRNGSKPQAGVQRVEKEDGWNLYKTIDDIRTLLLGTYTESSDIVTVFGITDDLHFTLLGTDDDTAEAFIIEHSGTVL